MHLPSCDDDDNDYGDDDDDGLTITSVINITIITIMLVGCNQFNQDLVTRL